MLKDRATNEELLVVLFTLYLKEDVDADGNVKDGVEGGKPIHLMNDSEKKTLESNTNGAGAESKDVKSQNGGVEKPKETLPDTNEDDVD